MGSSRGDIDALGQGVFVALFSGFGVALSVLNDNIASLVGVAISAALLPPAVNTGIYIVLAILETEEESHHLLVEGMISMALTLMNILLIFIAASACWYVEKIWIPLNSSNTETTIKVISKGRNLLLNKKTVENKHADLASVFEISPVHSGSFIFPEGVHISQILKSKSHSSRRSIIHDDQNFGSI